MRNLDSITNQNKIFVPLAIFVPFGLAWLGNQVPFWLGAVIGNPIGIIVAIGVGIWLVSKIQFSRKVNKITFSISYILLLVIGSAFIGLLVSCTNGDCI